MSKNVNEETPMLGFRYPKKKKEYLVKFYGKNLSELLREQADILIVRSLKMENK